jgi:hypothetical protein
MAGNWAESRALTQKAWAILGSNRRILSFPILAALINVVVIVVFAIPVVLLFVLGTWVTVVLGIILAAVGIYLTQIIAMIAKGGMVSCADEALAGRPMALGTGWSRSFARFGDVAQWAFISMVVGALLGAIRGNGQGNLAGVLLRNVVAAAAGVAWSVITLFVLPAIILDGSGVIAGIKSSAHIVKERWGTQITGGIRIAGRLLFLILPALALVLGGVFAIQASVIAGGVLFVLGFIVMIIAGLLGSTVRTIFSVALYRFVTTGRALGGFTPEELQAAVRTRG